MEVSEEDVADVQAEFIGVRQVLLDIALRVDDDRSRAGLVSDEIRRMREAAQIVLFQNHANLQSSAALLSRARQQAEN